MRGAKQDVWYHITATFDGKKLVTFLNGKSADQGNFTLSTGAGQLIIGQSDYRRILEGQVDELRIYNRALSAEEVSALYNLEKPQDRFKEGLTPTIHSMAPKDESGNGNDGKIFGPLVSDKDRHGKMKIFRFNRFVPTTLILKCQAQKV